MNQKKARALRRAIGFKPRARREYEETPVYAKLRNVNGVMRQAPITGAITATGPRREYQAIKRTRGMAEKVLGAR